jgi:uncharacterized protein with LGFP repeats
MATLITKTVTNNTALTQVYLDYAGNSVSVAPGETKTYQDILDNSSGLPDNNIPADSTYLKLKNSVGDAGYIKLNSERTGIRVTKTL